MKRDLWQADVRLFADSVSECVCRFEYEADAREFFFEMVNRIGGTDYKIAKMELVTHGEDDVLAHAMLRVNSPSCVSGPYYLVVSRVTTEEPPILRKGGSYDFIGAQWEGLF